MGIFCADYLHIDRIQSMRFDQHRCYKGKTMEDKLPLFLEGYSLLDVRRLLMRQKGEKLE